MNCLACDRPTPRLYLTLRLCAPCASRLPQMSVNKAEARRRCEFRAFRWPRGPQSEMAVDGAFRHRVIARWLGSHEDPTLVPIEEEFGNEIGRSGYDDEDGAQLRHLQNFARTFTPPARESILCIEGEAPFEYPETYQAPNLYGDEHVDRLAAVVLLAPGEAPVRFVWTIAHDLVYWLDRDAGHLMVYNFKGFKQADSSIQSIAESWAALKIWRYLGARSVTWQARSLVAPWRSEPVTWTLDDLPTMEMELVHLAREFHSRKESAEWEATANDYCGDCPRLGRCPAVTGELAREPKPGALIDIPLPLAPTAVVLEEAELYPGRLKQAEAFGKALKAEAQKRLVELGADEPGTPAPGKMQPRVIRVAPDRVARVYDHAEGYSYDLDALIVEAKVRGVQPEDHQRLELHGTIGLGRQALALVDLISEWIRKTFATDPAFLVRTVLDRASMIEAMKEWTKGKRGEGVKLDRRLEEIRRPIDPSPRLSFAEYSPKKHGTPPLAADLDAKEEREGLMDHYSAMET